MTILEMPGVYKIGYTADVESRRRSLNAGHCFKVNVVAVYKGFGHCELPVHDILSPFRVKSSQSREWFKTSVEHIDRSIRDIISKESPAEIEVLTPENETTESSKAAEATRRNQMCRTLCRKPNGNSQQKDLYIMMILELPGVFKVGRTANTEKRRRALNDSHCFQLKVIGEYKNAGHHELPIHDLLAPYRVQSGSSREWFSCSSEHIHETILGVISRQAPPPTEEGASSQVC